MSSKTFRIEVWLLNYQNTANKLVNLAHQLGIQPLTGSLATRLFFVKGEVDQSALADFVQTVLVDPVTEQFHICAVDEASPPDTTHFIEVTFLPGVTDTVAENLLRTAHLAGLTNIEEVATGQHYALSGDLSDRDLHRLAVKALSNPTIQRYTVDQPITPPFVTYHESKGTVEVIPLRKISNDELMAISAERRLSLDLKEMQTIQVYFQEERRDPTDVELEMLAQTWSEHCVHKTFKATIDYTEITPHGETQETINGLLNTYIRKATDTLNKDWVRSAFVDNAGIIKFDDRWDIAFKVETHNHPSAIEPFGGANTGVGGVIRDVLGVSARPIANTDVLCFGLPDTAPETLSDTILHPRRIEDGVIHGIEDYGNKMGIPTVNGAILYHPGYTANPLVFCGCLGILPHGSHPTQPQSGDLIIVMGGRTGRDGLRGATFSSMEMDHTTGEVSGSAVQIGHPIHEKQILEVMLLARDENLYHAVTDCGAGGLSSAVGEIASEIGASVQLQDVPLKYKGLLPWEIWLSEAQERMVLAVAPEKWTRLQALCNLHDLEAVQIGTFEPTGRLKLYYGDQLVSDVKMHFLHKGIPTRHLNAIWQSPEVSHPDLNGVFRRDRSHVAPSNVDLSSANTIAPESKLNFEESLLTLLAHPDIRSKEKVVTRYDHEVQGGTSVKPLVGRENRGPGDAVVLVPLDTLPENQQKGVALSNGVCPAYSEFDPYAMAWAAIDEAMRNIVAVGADPDQVAILDNFCWGNPNLPDRLGSLVRCAKGCHDAALAYGTPFISGKDSLNNEYSDESGNKYAIPGTLLISAVGIVPDVQKTLTMDLKKAGNYLYLIGETRNEMGGSHYHLINDLSGGTVPQPNQQSVEVMRRLHQAIQQGLIEACHDCSEGGLAVALSEMCIAGNLGTAVLFDLSLPDETAAFSESSGRFIVEVSRDAVPAFKTLMADVPFTALGVVQPLQVLEMQGKNSQLIQLSISDLEKAWRGEEIPASVPNIPVITKQPSSAKAAAALRTTSPKVIILHANGTNRDREAALACKVAGGDPEIVHINQLLNRERNLLDYGMLVLPGGFSYGDDLGAGVLWAFGLNHYLKQAMDEFVAQGRPVLGICNGFQTLVKAGYLPGTSADNSQRTITLTHNASERFECRWVYLRPNPNSANLFIAGFDSLITCPVAHGEGRVAACEPETLAALYQDGLAPLTYVDAHGNPAAYPHNPNGSTYGIAALGNAAGNVLGLMPHPEDHIFNWQHPRWHRGENGMLGIKLFENGIRNA